ncbi:MAG: hypothetical protein ACPGQL_07570 [Thermoplasmatota archaeon]
MKQFLVLAALLSAALAGCLGDDGDDDPVRETVDKYGEAIRYVLPEDPMPEGAGHDHTAVDQHQFLWNYEFSARDPLGQNAANIAGVHALDLQAGYLFGAVYGSHAVAVDGGLAIWDLADPAQPSLAGQLRLPGAIGGDRSMEATQDGNYAVIVTETVTCFGQVSPTSAVFNAYLIDTSDKSLPIIADVITGAGPAIGSPTRVNPSIGEHSVAVHNIGGIDYAFIFGKIFEISGGENSGVFVDTGAVINVGHDLYLRDTPWGDVWALSANGGGGLQIYNVTDPMNPVEIGNWDVPDRDSLTESYYLHTADVAFFDEQIIIMISSEDWLDWVSPFWILDATELEGATSAVVMEDIGMWGNPGNHTAIGTSFSLHNPRFTHDGILTLSSYHGGLWQLDFRHPEFRAEPAEIAYAVYAEGTPTQIEDPVFDAVETTLCGLGLTMDAPTYMDVEVHPSGILYAADVFLGLFTFTPSADHPVFGEGFVAPEDAYAVN